MENLKIKDPSEEDIEHELVCPALGNTLMIDSLGNISVCCIDESVENKVGNLKDMDLYEALNSEKIKIWIKAQIEQKKDEMAPRCKDCHFYKEYLKK